MNARLLIFITLFSFAVGVCPFFCNPKQQDHCQKQSSAKHQSVCCHKTIASADQQRKFASAPVAFAAGMIRVDLRRSPDREVCADPQIRLVDPPASHQILRA